MSKQYAVSMVLSAVDRATAPIRKVRAAMKSIRDRAVVTARALGLPKVTEKLAGVRNAIGRIGSMAASALGPLVALGGVASVGGFVALATSAAGAGDEIAKTADRLGVGIEAFQELQYAAERSGASTSEFRQGMRDLTKNIGEAANGTGEAKEVFKALGISLRDASGRVRTTESVMAEFADKLSNVPDASIRSAAAMKVMGESGGKMVNMLALGSAEIAKLREEARQYGVMTEEQARQSEAFADRLTNFNRVVGDLKNQLGLGLFPVLGPTMEKLRDFIQAHKPQIVAAVSEAVGTLTVSLERVDWAAAWEGAKTFFSVLSSLVEVVGGVGNALLIVGGVMLAEPLMAVFSLTKAVYGLGVAFMSTPVGWILAAIAAIAGAVYLIYKHWDSIAAWFTGKLDAVKAAFGDGFLNGIMELFAQFNPWRLWWETMDGFVQAVFGWDLSGWIKQQIAAITDALPDWLKERLGISVESDGDVPAASAPPLGPQRMAPPPAVSAASSTGRGGDVQPSRGEVTVRFENAPAGTRVDKRESGLGLGTDVTYGRSLIGQN